MSIRSQLSRLMAGKYPTAMLIGATSLSMVACASVESQGLNIFTYAPVIDVKGEGYDTATYYTDLEECRQLGIKVQATYEEQRKKELSQARTSAITGIILGAIAGQVIADNNDVHSGRAVTTGALYGGALGGALGGEAVDYERAFTKFGPTGIVDQCMTNRGYNILSAHGFGGG